MEKKSNRFNISIENRLANKFEELLLENEFYRFDVREKDFYTIFSFNNCNNGQLVLLNDLNNQLK